MPEAGIYVRTEDVQQIREQYSNMQSPLFSIVDTGLIDDDLAMQNDEMQSAIRKRKHSQLSQSHRRRDPNTVMPSC